jgi:hypothetical protein
MMTATCLRKRTDRNAKRLTRATAKHFSVVATLLIATLVGLASLAMLIPEKAKPTRPKNEDGCALIKRTSSA